MQRIKAIELCKPRLFTKLVFDGVSHYSQSPILVTLYARKLRIFSFNAPVRGCANTAFQHYGGVEIVSPQKCSESDEQLLFTRSKPKSRTLWDAKSIKIIHPPSIVSRRRVDGGGSRFLKSRACSGAQRLHHGFPVFQRCNEIELESWRGLPQNNFKQVLKCHKPAKPWNGGKSSLHNSIFLVW